MFEAHTRHLNGSEIEQIRRRANEAKAALVYSAVRRITRPLGNWLADVRQRRRNVRVLESLDDRTLADIGVVRGDIPEIARRGVAVGRDLPDFGVRPDRGLSANPDPGRSARREEAATAVRFPRSDIRPVPRQRKAA